MAWWACEELRCSKLDRAVSYHQVGTGFRAIVPIFERRPSSSALRLKNPP